MGEEGEGGKQGEGKSERKKKRKNMSHARKQIHQVG